MSCQDCPEPIQPLTAKTDIVCLMPRECSQPELASLLRRANLTVTDDCVIESDTPLEGLRQDGRFYHLDWIPCTWKLLQINLPKITTTCILNNDTHQCATCPNRHTK